MKNTIICFFFIGILYLFTACEDELKFGNAFLEKPPTSTSINKDTIFSRLLYAERYLWSGYNTLPYGIYNYDILNYGYLDMLTDMLGNNTQENVVYFTGNYNSSSENGFVSKYYWYQNSNRGGWLGIRIANIFLANIDRVPDVDENYKRQLKAEARMLMAFHYSELYRNYGGMIWINHELAVSETGPFPRLTSIATMDSIVSLIDRAIPDLPWVVDDPVDWDGRLTKAAAMAIKARVLLFGASPLFNSAAPYMDGEAAQKNLVWHGNYDANLWKKAADAAHELIAKVESEGGYGIVNTGNPRKDFQDSYFPRGKGEVLFSSRSSGYNTDGGGDGYGIISWLGSGCYTNDYVEMFPMANGLPITDPASGYDPAYPFFNAAGTAVRDPRLYETVLVNGDYYQGRTVELWIGGRDRASAAEQSTQTGYGPRKFTLERSTSTNIGAFIQWPIIRLNEIYLSYAEAINEFNNGPTAEAYRCVNLIRNRVNLPNLPAGLSKEQFREALLNERACEFGMEKVRWFDLVRWKRADVFQKQLHAMDITKDVNTGILTYTLRNLPIRYWATTWSPKWYLSAFPLNEILKGYGLIQNPGWEI